MRAICLSVYIQQVAGVKDGCAAATFFTLERERGRGRREMLLDTFIVQQGDMRGGIRIQ